MFQNALVYIKFIAGREIIIPFQLTSMNTALREAVVPFDTQYRRKQPPILFIIIINVLHSLIYGNRYFFRYRL